jgi:predicted transcriptional regulator
MAILKAPPRQPKNETIQLRVSQDLKFRLTRYAEFIHATTSYVVSEMLDRLFRKDTEFQEYLAAYKPPESGDHSDEERAQPAPNNVMSVTKK